MGYGLGYSIGKRKGWTRPIALYQGGREDAFVDRGRWGEDWLHRVLNGDAYLEGGKRIPKVFGKFSDGRIRDEKWRIHVYLWFDVGEHEGYDEKYIFTLTDEEKVNRLCTLLGRNPGEIRRWYT